MTDDPGALVIAGLEAVAALAIAAFWVSWFRGSHEEDWLPEGYVHHERAFVYADALLAALLVASAVLLLAGNPLGQSLSLVCAGMLAFLGVVDAAYFWQTGLFARARGGLINGAVVAAVLGLAVVLVLVFS